MLEFALVWTMARNRRLAPILAHVNGRLQASELVFSSVVNDATPWRVPITSIRSLGLSRQLVDGNTPAHCNIKCNWLLAALPLSSVQISQKLQI